MMDLLLRRRAMMMQNSAPSDTYLTFTANTAGSTIEMQAVGSAPSVSLEYSTDGGVTWQTFTVGSTTVTLANVGDKVKMRGTNTKTASSGGAYNKFVMAGSVAASGDVTSILNGVGGDVTLGNYYLAGLFWDCTSLTAAPNLPSTTIGQSTYSSTFRSCTSLTAAPELPPTTLPRYSCEYMFLGCSSLTYVKIYALSLVSVPLYRWLESVSPTGDFYCDPSLNIPSGINGIPSGWTRYNLDGTPY